MLIESSFMRNLLFIMIACLSLVSCQESQIKKCTINGRVVGRASSTIYLTNALERPDQPIAKISINDSAFSFNLDPNPEQAYWLIFEDEFMSRDGLHPIIFFPDRENINLTLYDLKRIDQNKISGGKLNKQFAGFKKELKEKYDPRHQSTDSIFKEIRNWSYNYYEKNQTLVSYYLLLDELHMGYNIGSFDERYSDLSRIKDLVKTFSAKFPDHPYTSRSKDLVAAYDKIRVGGEYIDFTLPDLDGDTITLSELIKDKITLIDLWASWCGPCIATSRSMIPVYNEFKDSGFTVIGVANEFDNIDRLRKTLEKEKFPWLNLVELDGKHSVMAKYNLTNAAGGTFLVDKDGKILAINPTAEEVRSILAEKLTENAS
jgi:peroxiredoxin